MTEQSSNGWRKSTRSTNGDTCVEARVAETGFEVRDSKLREDSPILDVTVDDFAALLIHGRQHG